MELSTTQRFVIGGGIVVLLAAVVCIPVLRGAGSDDVSIIGTTPQTPSVPPAPGDPALVTVHVVGAVRRPGVYCLYRGARVHDALNAAGGLRPQADVSAINLAASLDDGKQVFVPVRAYAPPSGQGVQARPQAPQRSARQTYATTPPPLVVAPGTSRTTNPTPAPAAPTTTYQAARTATVPAAKPRQPAAVAPAAGSSPGPSQTPQFRININRATEQELQALPHIGPTIAARIVAYRTQHAGFRRLEELTQIKGIAEKTLSDLRPHITL